MNRIFVRPILAVGVVSLMIIASGCTRSPEAKSAAYLETGKKLLKQNDASRAILQFKNAAAATPKNPEVYYQLSLAQLAGGDVQGGVTSLRVALELDPQHKAARLKMAELLSLTTEPGLWKEAEQRLRELMEDSPDNLDVLRALATTELKLGETEDAVEHLGRAFIAAPKELSLAVMLTQAKLQQRDVRGAEDVLRQAIANDPRSADARVLLGRFYRSQQRMREAEEEFKRALELDGNSGPALLNLGMLQHQTGVRDAADATFKRLSVLPDKAFHPLYGMYLFQTGRRSEAIVEFEKAMKESPEDRRVRSELISAYRAVNREPDAVNLLSRALAKNRKDTDALLQRAELALANGKYSDAEVDINQVLRFNSVSAPGHYLLAKINQARGAELRYRQELSEAVRLSPYSLPVRFELASHLVSTNAAAAALEVLNGAADAQKRTTPFLVQRNWALWAAGDLQELRKGIDYGLGRERSGELLLQDGLWRLRSNDVVGARKSLEEALKLNPRDLRALTAVRQSYLMQKQGQLAVRKIKEFAAQHPESAPAQEFLGSVLLATGDYVQARAVLTIAEAAVGDSTTAQMNLARLDVIEHNWDSAAGRLKKGLSADSNNTTLRLWLGFVEGARGDQEAALGHFREVVKLSPGNADGLNNLAYLLADYKKQPDEALPYAERAKELSPDDPEIADTLGWVLYQKGLYPSAIQHLERAVAKGQNPTSRSHLAMAYAKAGEVKRARSVLAPVLKQYPNSADAKLALTVVGN